ncbi:hypothetical protein X742_15005 [Mesorhizobium sp. LNHC232B00]|nr:hypothetical protein X742_15005 [Mesorhizobium sp. LNHC232B00]
MFNATFRLWPATILSPDETVTALQFDTAEDAADAQGQ